MIHSSELTADEMKQRRIDRARRRYAEYPRADLGPVEGCNLIADRGSGNLFVRVMRSVLEAQNPSTVSNVSGFFLTEDEEIVSSSGRRQARRHSPSCTSRGRPRNATGSGNARSKPNSTQPSLPRRHCSR